MNKSFAMYLTTLIAIDLEKHKDVSSGMCEKIEESFINEKYDVIEGYIKDFLEDKRTVSQIVKEQEN